MEQKNIAKPLSEPFLHLKKQKDLLFSTLPIQQQLLARYKKLLGNTRVIDLLYHFPLRTEVREAVYTLNDIYALLKKNPKVLMSAIVEINDYETPKFRSKSLRIHAFLDDGTPVKILYFNGKLPWIQKLYPLGQRKVITGTCSLVRGVPTFTHPDYVDFPSLFKLYVGSFPVYPLSAGVSQAALSTTIKTVLENYLPDLPEWIDPHLLEEYGWPSWREALLNLHSPTSNKDLDPSNSKSYQRLIYDEIFARQLDIYHIQRKSRKLRGKSTAKNTTLFEHLKKILPFTLTHAQKNAIEEIYKDMHQNNSMRRLLQGDVGSGKTLVAFSAALFALESGFQVAFLAPTEILARQHAAKILPLANQLGLKLDLLLGGKSQNKDGKKARQRILTGESQLIIGTHALIDESVIFQNLGLAIIDEQHRFGVDQRLRLIEKGDNADMLAMTATPIPRSLQMTLFTDMDTTFIKEKPAGRLDIQTSLLDKSFLKKVIESLGRHIEKGGQAYWVCPLVEESQNLDLAAVENRYSELNKVFPGKISLIHGRLKSCEKDTIMQGFSKGETSILVATTVIEVGVDIPNVSLIIIEHAERFGLAQLHQLRGRVGRNSLKSHCFLIYDPPLTDTAKSRLSIMRETNDGFLLAEEDLKLRGGGDIYGTQQSGYAIFKLAHLSRDIHLFHLARDKARLHISTNVKDSPQLLLLRVIFKKYETDDYIKAG